MLSKEPDSAPPFASGLAPDGKGGKAPVVNFTLDVDPPVREDIYEYFEGAID
ncbi:hypothetical protein [uncultured Slackia sp.]|uniref:hypothetical protein n=1 Tax=uncultured Slackia sp. TaxID=665903 RepID=UPI0025ED7260|nr:hypothetical protein [uncultured Slackia sp.]